MQDEMKKERVVHVIELPDGSVDAFDALDDNARARVKALLKYSIEVEKIAADEIKTLNPMMAIIAKFKRLDESVKASEGSLKTKKAERLKVHDALLEEFASETVSMMTYGGKTFFLHCKSVASVDKKEDEETPDANERIIKMLDELELESFAPRKVDFPAIMSHIAQLEEDSEPLPKEFEGAIKTFDIISIRSRKAAKK